MAKKKRTLSPKMRAWTDAARQASKEGLKPGTPDFAARQREIVEGSPAVSPESDSEDDGLPQAAGGAPNWRRTRQP